MDFVENISNKNIINNNSVTISGSNLFWFSKRSFDIIFSIALLPILILSTIIIFFLNFIFNRGSIFFIQERMGKNCEPFYAIKYRTMIEVDVINRNYSDPLEVDRITFLGASLRKIRLDELPQILNVIKGDMSLIGPRPDYYKHAQFFLKNIPDYRQRHLIRPGISGLSQIRLGYAEGVSATKKKSRVDVYYIKNASFYLELKIFFATLAIIFKAMGS